MPKRRKKKAAPRRTRRSAPSLEPGTRRIIAGIAQVAFSALLFLSLFDAAGPSGASIKTALQFVFGAWGIFFALALLASGVMQASGEHRLDLRRSTGLFLCLLTFLGIVHLGADLRDMGPRSPELGGALGFMVSLPFKLYLSDMAGYVLLSALFLIGIFLVFEPDVAAIVRLLSSKQPLSNKQKAEKKAARMEEEEDDEEEVEDDEEEEEEDLVEEDGEAPELNIVRPAFAQAKQRAGMIQKPKAVLRKDVLEMKDTRFEEWTFPGMDLLEAAESELKVNDEELRKQAKLIEDKLAEFDIDVVVKDARPGPTVTQFTVKPSEGVKLSKIANLKDDLALALAAQSLRIEAPIPGKDLVGIEMPNSERTMVRLREILESPAFNDSESTLTFPLGRDVSGDAVVSALDEMPHLLIAGATGSGKSVCMNVFLTALLYQNAPHELKFILIDPKRVELMPYNGIPHLLTPVITEAEKALQALRWAVAEMGRRLHRFSDMGVRNIAEYNEKQQDETLLLPRIVIVIDELADLMMRQFRRDTETMIVRIAQMARATGMHLIIATQRPSVDVITGLIKANIPTRMAFRTVSSVDSRTILDTIGSEDLLGKGDMLYMTASTAKPVRVQGIYVNTKEVERVINAVKIAGGGKITEQIGLAEDDENTPEDETDMQPSGGSSLAMPNPYQTIDLDADDNGGDDLFFDAVRVVTSSGKASASLLQRQLKVGYARAARLLDIMEEKGLVGPADGAKPRRVFAAPDSNAKPNGDRFDM
jgi:S-DNA-T family DNA segregation ATPase FtsK/SpoIIIE